MKQKNSNSILRKFLLFNLLVFSILGLITFIYLSAIQPNLVKKRTTNHYIIIKNTNDHLERLNIKFDRENLKTFLLSTRFLFQSLDRVQFYSLEGKLIGDTNILDLDQSVFEKSEKIFEESIDGTTITQQPQEEISFDTKEDIVKEKIQKKNQSFPLVIENIVNNNFFVSTLSEVTQFNQKVGYIIISEEANDILLAVSERKNFILRTVLAIGLVILIFSLFLNKYVLKPIGYLVRYTQSIKNKSLKNIDIENFVIRRDEVGILTKSIDEMTKELQKRTNRAETFSTDLAHEIRNPLASLKGASELLDKSHGTNDREKLLKIITHDVERIERLITDYSQMLKDEASLSREKMKKVNLIQTISNVVEDFRQDIKNQNKNLKIEINFKNKNGKEYYVLGIENRLEQVVANLLDNSISFSDKGKTIEIEIAETSSNFVILVKDEGPGFEENSPQRIFNRFYSNRPKSFGKHSGLGLNIVKNIVELHKGTISASNRVNTKGAQIEVLLPKFN